MTLAKRQKTHTDLSDVMLVIGSSCTVSSAAAFPLKVTQKKNTLVIINRQPTPIDKYATMRIGASCDDVMKIVAEQLNLEIPKFIIHRHIILEFQNKESNCTGITIRGVDERGIRSSFIKGVVVTLPPIKSQVEVPAALAPVEVEAVQVAGPPPPPAPVPPPAVQRVNVQEAATRKVILTQEPFVFDVPNEDMEKVHVKIRFMAHYGEPQIEMDLIRKEKDTLQNIYLTYDPSTQNWECENVPIKQHKDI